ncbi:MAG: hypothetical protein WC438_05140 [Candidatus Pacearchaeota archaeon]
MSISINSNKMEEITIEKLLGIQDNEEKDYLITSIPTGMYADRESYGNRPLLSFILDGKLPCKASAYPYSSKPKVSKENINDFKGLLKKFANLEFCADSENLGIAAAMIDQAIRNKESIEVHGKYSDNILTVEYLKVGNFGFQFDEYTLPGTKQNGTI